MLKTIFFDLDDTLIDWSGFSGDWRSIEGRHLNGVFEYINRDVHPLDDCDAFADAYFQRVRSAWTDSRDSLRAPHVGRLLLDTAIAFGVPREALDMDRCLDAYAWRVIDGTVLFPDVMEVLVMLRDRGLHLGIVTNAGQPMRLRDMELEELGLLPLFPDCRFAAADVGYLKPHPSIFQAALDCAGVRVEEAVFVGDNPRADIAGAQRVGLKAVLRSKNYDSPLTVDEFVEPDARIDSLLELPALLEEWFPGWA
jgi:putative hydrolase of the HAD superfamily